MTQEETQWFHRFHCLECLEDLVVTYHQKTGTLRSLSVQYIMLIYMYYLCTIVHKFYFLFSYFVFFFRTVSGWINTVFRFVLFLYKVKKDFLTFSDLKCWIKFCYLCFHGSVVWKKEKKGVSRRVNLPDDHVVRNENIIKKASNIT